ncbi:MAG: flavodoxin family protein [Deltaproteobacteria bacterium]|nr:flavodoxin family protein [Deltaproteobacteria bacterium]
MNVLGLSASCRQWGNTDILVHTALRGADEEGAETRFLRIPDLGLGPCVGCMACVFKDRDCVQKDRLPEFLEAMRWADAVVLGSPCYVLGATAQVKNLHDRMIRFGIRREFVGKPGLALVAAGVPGWEPLALSQVSLFFLFLGMPVVDQFIGHAQGPGEIFDDPVACDRALEAGRALGRGETAYRGDPGACPVCHMDLVTTRPDGAAHCLLCDLPGTWEDRDGGRRFVPAPGAEPRWSPGSMRHHFEERILPSGPRFKARIREIRERIGQFRAGGQPWKSV